MHAILTVYHALRSYARPATRGELEREAGIGRHTCRKGLDGLRRRGALEVVGQRRQTCTYRLVKGTPAPVTLSGRYLRQRTITPPLRLPDAAPWPYGAPPPVAAHAGLVRTVLTGLLDVRHELHQPFPPCALAEIWRRRSGP